MDLRAGGKLVRASRFGDRGLHRLSVIRDDQSLGQGL